MSTEFNPPGLNNGEGSYRPQPGEQPLPQSIDQARFASDLRTQDGSSLPQNQPAVDHVAAPIKHDLVQMAPEQQPQITQAQAPLQPAQAQSAPMYQVQPSQPIQPTQEAPVAAPMEVVQAPVAAQVAPQQLQHVAQSAPVAGENVPAPSNVDPAPQAVQMTGGVPCNGPPQPATHVQAEQPQPSGAVNQVPQSTMMASLGGQPSADGAPQASQADAPAAVQRVLPPIRPRKNSDDCIYIDADMYQAAMINIDLPHGIKIVYDDDVTKQIKRAKTAVKKKQQKLAQEEKKKKREAQLEKIRLQEVQRQQKLQEKAEKDRLARIKREEEALAARRKAMADAAAAKAAAASQKEAQVAMKRVADPLNRQESLVSQDNADGEAGNARKSGRAQPKKDYSAMDKGTNKDFTKPNLGSAKPSNGGQPANKSIKSQGSSNRGIQPNKLVMSQCQDLLKQVRESCRAPRLTQQLAQADQITALNQVDQNLQDIANKLKDFRFQRACDMTSKIKEAVYGILKLGELNNLLYPTLMHTINETTALIEASKLADKTVFSQISQIHSNPEIKKQLDRKNKEVDQLKKRLDRQESTGPSKDSSRHKKTDQKALSQSSKKNRPPSKVAGKPERPKLEENPLTVEERDNLIKQINFLPDTQKQEIINIVQNYAQRDESNQVSFELTQLPVKLCRQLEAFVLSCIKQNDKKAKRKEKDKQRRDKKREEREMKNLQQNASAGQSQQQQQKQGSQQVMQNAPVASQPQVSQQIQMQGQQPVSMQAQESRPVNNVSQLQQATQQAQAQAQQQLINMQAQAQAQAQAQQPLMQMAQTGLVQGLSQPQQMNQASFMPQQQQQAKLNQQAIAQQQNQNQAGFVQQNTSHTQFNQATALGQNQLGQSLQQLQNVASGQQPQQQVMQGQLAQANFGQQQIAAQMAQQQPASGAQAQQPQYHAQQPQQVNQTMSLPMDQMDNETLLSHYLSNPQAVSSQISQQRFNELENYKQLQQQKQLQYGQQTQQLFQQAQNQQNQQQPNQQPQGSQPSQQAQLNAAAVLQSKLNTQQQAIQQLQIQQQLQQQVGAIQQQTQSSQQQQNMQQMQQSQVNLQQHPHVMQQSQITMQQQPQQQHSNQAQNQQHRLRPEDESDSSSSDSDDEDNGAAGMPQRANLNQGAVILGQANQHMMGQAQQLGGGGETEITRVWQNNENQ